MSHGPEIVGVKLFLNWHDETWSPEWAEEEPGCCKYYFQIDTHSRIIGLPSPPVSRHPELSLPPPLGRLAAEDDAAPAGQITAHPRNRRTATDTLQQVESEIEYLEYYFPYFISLSEYDLLSNFLE